MAHQALIELTGYGKFFIQDERSRVWDGDAWRGFGMAELYPTFAAAFRDRRRALANREAESAAALVLHTIITMEKGL